jgi:UDP-N-acetylglucosamine--N-acetylmuramyl-(pentapeptide) pyrophosphoryl-undecaprenol N-acetylglucosamine transferase
MKRIMFAGGGTGGHLFPAFAIAEEFKRRLPDDCEIRFFVTGRDIEMKLISSRGYDTTRIHVRGLKRGTLVGNAMFLPVLFFGIIEAIAKVISYDPKLVVGTGGYLSFPAVLAAKITNRPAFIQEQNSYAGIATQKLARFADLIFIAHHESLRNIKFHDRCILSGNPVNPKMGTVDREEAITRFKLDLGKKTLLILGGSQGAASINAKIRQSLTELNAISNLQLIWQVGNHQSEVDTFRTSGVQGIALLFIDDMPAAYAAADLVLSRAGALTLAEISATGKPAILVPFPHATDDHQTKNAQSLEQAGAAMIIKDAQLPKLNLAGLISQLLNDDDKLASMSMASQSLGRRDAAAAIVQRIFEYMGWR